MREFSFLFNKMLIFINKLTHVSTCYQAGKEAPAGQNIDVESDIGDLISFCLNALLTFFFFLGQISDQHFTSIKQKGK